MTDRYRHKARGTTYRVLYEAAKASSIIEALDHMTMVVYQSEEAAMFGCGRPLSSLMVDLN